MKILLFFIILIVASCSDGANSNIGSNSSTGIGSSESNTGDDTVATDKTNVIVRDDKSDTLITVSFPKDSTWTKIEGKMRGISHPITVLIPVKQGKQLSAFLQTEDSTANIRINQIFTADGKADGPFGKEIKYPIKKEGTYKLIIGENMMQGDEWKGTFWLTVSVK